MNIIDKHTFRVQENLTGSAKIIFVFTAMGTKIGLYQLFMKRMRKLGYDCIIYDYPLTVIHESRPSEWEYWYQTIIGDAQARIKQYNQTGVKHYFAYGVSMGTLIANMFTRETPEINHLVLNLTYGDVATTLWTWNGVKRARRNLMADGHTLESTRDVVAFADPVVNAAKLKGKKVLLQLSRTDRVLRYDLTRHTLQALRDAGVGVEYCENKYLGHFAGGTKNMMQTKKLAEFYS